MSEKENSINIGGENIVDDIVLGNLAASKRSIADLLSQKIKTEVDKKKIQLEKELKQLKNLELEAKIKVSSTEYMLDMVSK